MITPKWRGEFDRWDLVLAGIALALGTWIVETVAVIAAKIVVWGGAFLGWVATDVLPKLPGILGGILSAIGGFIGGAISWLANEAAKLGKGIIDAQADAQGRWGQLQGDLGERNALDHLAAAPAPAADQQRPGRVVDATNPDWYPVAATKAGGLTGSPDDITGNLGTGVDYGEWTDRDEAAFQDALAGAKGPLDQQNGEVVTATGPSNQGVAHSGAINVNWGKTKNPDGTTNLDYEGWWGGASDMRIGDQRIPPATWYALAMLTPRQRAAWWKKNGSNFG